MFKSSLLRGTKLKPHRWGWKMIIPSPNFSLRMSEVVLQVPQKLPLRRQRHRDVRRSLTPHETEKKNIVVVFPLSSTISSTG